MPASVACILVEGSDATGTFGVGLLRTTDEHPFWVEGRGWVQASALAAGDKLRPYTGDAGRHVDAAITAASVRNRTRASSPVSQANASSAQRARTRGRVRRVSTHPI